MDLDAVLGHILAEFFGAFDDGGDDFAGNIAFIAADGAGKQEGSGYAGTNEIVGIHDDGILGNAFPYA